MSPSSKVVSNQVEASTSLGDSLTNASALSKERGRVRSESRVRSGRSASSSRRKSSVANVSSARAGSSLSINSDYSSRSASSVASNQSATSKRSQTTDSECIKVAVRCRPMSEKEIADGHESIIEFVRDKGEIIIHNPNLEPSNLLGTRKSTRRNLSKVFKFDAVFDWNSRQDDIYNLVCRPIVDSVLKGFNGTIFAYGQTGTGKTYTMEGLDSLRRARRKSSSALATQCDSRPSSSKRSTDTKDEQKDSLRGIIPKAFEHIFKHIANNPDIQYLVRSSYLEIYQEEIRDLLSKDQNKRLELHEHPEVGVFVKDLTSFVCKSIKEIERVMNVGNQNRSVGATDMNEHSSRSHAIFMITIEQQARARASADDSGSALKEMTKNISNNDNRLLIKVGKLNLVDLAGSERQRKTNSLGQRQKEAIKINLSLSALGNVINSLMAASTIMAKESISRMNTTSSSVDKSNNSNIISSNNEKDDNNVHHTPYRDSKLTRLLQDSLGGNAKTLMLANIGPASYNYDETINTLMYASRAKCIQNRPRINEDPKDALLREFQKEIETLRAKLAALKNKKQQSGEQQTTRGSLALSNDENKEIESNNLNGDTNGRGGGTGVNRLSKIITDSNGDGCQSKKQSNDGRNDNDEDEEYESEQYKELLSLKSKLKSLESKLLNSSDCYDTSTTIGTTTNITRGPIKQQLKATTANNYNNYSLSSSGNSNKSISLNTAGPALDAIIEGYTNKQEFELEKRRQQLANQKEIEQDIKLRLSKQEELELETKQTFSSLQQELDIKTSKLKTIESQVQMIKKEIQSAQDANRLELDELDQVQSVLLKELKLKYLIMNNFIPKQYTDRLFRQQRLIYDESANTCRLKPLVARIKRSIKSSINQDDPSTSLSTSSSSSSPNVMIDYQSAQTQDIMPRYLGSDRLRARSKFERIGETIGSNIRYRYENILEARLVMPKCTLRSYKAPLISPKIQAALDGALSIQEKDIFI